MNSRRSNEALTGDYDMSEMQNDGEKKQATAQEVAAFVLAAMLAGGRVQQDKGRLEYKAEIHRALGATAMAAALKKFGLAPDAGNLRMLLALVDNHSAWRQKMVKEGIFPDPKDRPASAQVDDLLAELAEEGVGE